MSKKSYTVKKFIGDVHLWLGIGSGIILFIVCLSGTILTFEHELEAALHSEHFTVIPSETGAMNVDTLVSALEKQMNTSASGVRIWEDQTKAVEVFIKKTLESRPAMFLINQYTGVAIGEAPDTPFLHSMEQLHRFLLLDPKIGRPIVGVATIIFVVLCISGLILWWPKRKKKQLKQAFTVRLKSKWKRINYDLHNVLGFYVLIPLLIMGLTGLNWSFEWYRKGVSSIINDEVFKQRTEKPMIADKHRQDSVPISITASIAIADDIFDYSGNRYVILPGKPEEAIQVRKMRTVFFAVGAPDKVHLNQYSGQVLKIETFSQLPANEKLNALMRPLHIGDALGPFTKVIYFISCLIATTLPVTGTIIWINKLRKKQRKRDHKLKSA